jgi:DNA-binding CsgD family transcriptional regulator
LHYDLNNEQMAVVTTLPEANRYVFAHQAIATGPELETGIHYLPMFNGPSGRAELGLRFNIDNVIEFVYNDGKGNVEAFGFGTEIGKPNMVNYYFNNLEFLQQFINEYKNNAKDLIIKVSKEPIAVPGHNRILTNPIITSPKRDLTRREIDILKGLYLGLTAKEIAISLNLSHRTVESYIENIKNKTGLSRKTALIKYAITHRLVY